MTDADCTILALAGDDPAVGRELLDIAAALVPVADGDRARVIALVHDRGRGEAGAALSAPGSGPEDSPAIELRSLGRGTAGVWENTLAVARAEQARLLVFDWLQWTNPTGRVLGKPIEQVARQAPCALAAVKRGGLTRVRQVLLPVRGGPQGLLTLRLATALAERFDARITVLHIEQPGLPPEDDAAVRAQLDALLGRGGQPGRAEPAVMVAGSVESAILAEARNHQVVIMGASPGQPGTPYLFGPVAEAVAHAVESTLVVVKAPEAPTPAQESAPAPLTPRDPGRRR